MATFQKVYEEYAQPVYRFLLSLAGDESFAEELLQETFYQALQHIDKFEGRCSLYTWLCQIGKNSWIKEIQRNNRYYDLSWDDLTISTGAPSLETQVITKDEYRRAHQAMQKLKDPYRDVFIMHAIGGIKLKEIAYIYRKSESWARVTYFRARQQIAKEVQK